MPDQIQIHNALAALAVFQSDKPLFQFHRFQKGQQTDMISAYGVRKHADFSIPGFGDQIAQLQNFNGLCQPFILQFVGFIAVIDAQIYHMPGIGRKSLGQITRRMDLQIGQQREIVLLDQQHILIKAAFALVVFG